MADEAHNQALTCPHGTSPPHPCTHLPPVDPALHLYVLHPAVVAAPSLHQLLGHHALRGGGRVQGTVAAGSGGGRVQGSVLQVTGGQGRVMGGGRVG